MSAPEIDNGEGRWCENCLTPDWPIPLDGASGRHLCFACEPEPSCFDCGGVLEVTPSGAVTCREHGSEHYRAEKP